MTYPTPATCEARRQAAIEAETANARLIAAAPDMLAALKAFLLGAPSDAQLAEVVGEDVIREARAAIAKAEGKS
jgi:hypothetical protein